MSDQPVARPLPTQDNTIQKDADKHQCLERDSSPRSQQPTGQNPRLRPHGHCDRHVLHTLKYTVKSDPATRHGGAWSERRYSSYSFLTSALDEGEWSASRPGRALPPGKGLPVPIVQ
jgi:hypothetical protein